MSNPSITIYNGETDQTIVREMNADELVEHLEIVSAATKARNDREQAQLDKVALQAEVYTKLGLTEAEAIAIGLIPDKAKSLEA